MVSNISGMSAMPQAMPQQSMQNKALTSEQQQLVSETLAEFDPDSMTEADAQTIVEIFAEAGIQPGASLADTMNESGFDARTVGDMAGIQGPEEGNRPPPPPPQGQGISQSLDISDELLSDLNELLNEYYSDDISDDDKATTLSSIQDILKATAPEGGLINETA